MEAAQARLLRSSYRYLQSEFVKLRTQRIELGLRSPEPPQEEEEDEGGENSSLPEIFAIQYAMAEYFKAWKSLMASHEPPLHALICQFEGRLIFLDSCRRWENLFRREFNRLFLRFAVITNKKTRIWIDGGSFLESIWFMDSWTLMCIGEDPPIEVWLTDNLPPDANIGVNSWSISIDMVNKWEKLFVKKNHRLFPITTDFVNPFEMSPLVAYPLDFGDGSVSEKLKDVRVKLRQEGARGLLITTFDEVAWLYNIHGTNHAFAIVTTNSAFLCVKKKGYDEANSYLKKGSM